MQIPSNIPLEQQHPETGARMVLVVDQTSFAKAARFTDREFGNPETGRRLLEAIQRKEAESGYLYRDPATGYEHRFKVEGGDTSGATAERSAGSSSSAAPSNQGGESVEEKRARLQRELAALG